MQQEEGDVSSQALSEFTEAFESAVEDEYNTAALQPSKEEISGLAEDARIHIQTIENERDEGSLFFGYSVERIAVGGAVTAGLAYLTAQMLWNNDS